MKFSLILPVYNVEKYIDKCMNTILEQTYSDFEVILVNDGSKDNSLSICRQYEKLDNRIKVIDKNNGGVSSARNEGMKQAIGEWIIFIDPDDWIDNQCLKKCAELIENQSVDMVCYNAIKVYENNLQEYCPMRSIEPDLYVIGEGEKKELFYSLAVSSYRNHFYAGELVRAVWGKTLKRDLIIENDLKFDTSLSHGEDCVFLMEYLHVSKKILLSNEYLYYYRIRSGSAVTSGPKDKEKVYSYQFKRIAELIKKDGYDREAESVLLACKLGCARQYIRGIEKSEGLVSSLKKYNAFINMDCFKYGKVMIKNNLGLHKREIIANIFLYYKMNLLVFLMYWK